MARFGWPRIDVERTVKNKVPFILRRVINPYFDQERFFNDALRYQWTVRNQPDIESAWGAYYEFGVGRMNSLLRYWRAYARLGKALGLDPPRIFGFDTFSGLPETTHAADRLKGWTPGAFAMSLAECESLIQKFKVPNVRFIQGLYEETLTPTLAGEMKAYPPGIINIDVDFYTSTVTVLDFLKPLLKPGVIVHFDDVWSFNGDPTRGQLRAIREFNEAGPFYLAPHWLGLGSNHVYAVSHPLKL
ncbi:MAG: TylF/MycF/NovP-related O-methyltransferase [Pyrinomonadaceae bacterium]